MNNDLDAVVLVHPDYFLSDMSTIYPFNLQYINSLYKLVAKPTIPIVSIHSDGSCLPDDIYRRVDSISPAAYFEPDILLSYLENRLSKPITELRVGLGGMFGNACVASFGQRAFESYQGQSGRGGACGNKSVIKGKQAILLEEICRFTR